MDINCYKYMELDEQELQREDEEQRKEIQALLTTEFYDLEIEEDDDENFNNEYSLDAGDEISTSVIEDDKENLYNCQDLVSVDETSTWLTPPLTAFFTAPQVHNLNSVNYSPTQSNNNCQREEDVSINWEISLHGEMGVPIPRSNNHFYTDKLSYMAISSHNPTEPYRISNVNIESAAKRLISPMKVIKKDVAVECIPVNQRELDNLELLYGARGKRIDQLQAELESEKEKRLRETRVLSHKITLLESEQKNESNLLKGYKVEVNEQRKALEERDNTISRQTQQLQECEHRIEKLSCTVDSRGGLVESLNQQLAELKTHTTMARNNQKQAELLDCINHQFDTDAHRFQMEISRLSERVDEKMVEIERLQVQLDEQARLHQSHKRSWAEEMERISEDLEEERARRQALESSTNQEKIYHLQKEISEVNLGKSMVEDMNFYLQEQVHELTNQILVFEQSLFMLENKEAALESCIDVGRDEPRVLGRARSCPMLQEVDEDDDDEEMRPKVTDSSVALMREIFSLTGRSHSLTNRLLDVRKDNLEAKSTVKKLQQTVNEQNELLFALEEKFAKTESRLCQLQSGNETDVERQLRNEIESQEIVKGSLEIQCKSLQTQLKQVNESMEEMNRVNQRLERDFEEFKDRLEEDKMCSIEEVKMACGSHYENLRQQLEISWMMEKESFVSAERRHREELQSDLCDAIKEVDRVKNLYIELSQQKTNEESDRTNWNAWLTKKLEDQKRSLNQQFQNDHQTTIMKMRAEHDTIVEELRSELQRDAPVEDKSCGTEVTVAEVAVQSGKRTLASGCQTDRGAHEVSAQTTETLRELSQMDDLARSNQRLQAAVDALKGELEGANLRSRLPTSSSSPEEAPQKDVVFHHMIRSCTPQIASSTTRVLGARTQNPADLHKLFSSLKEDLVTQLSEISRSSQCRPNGAKGMPRVVPAFNPRSSADRVKANLYDYILEMQARAASTLQQELHKAQARVRRDLLAQLGQVLPLTLSVDGQLIGIAPAKMRLLLDKLSLILARLEVEGGSPGPGSPLATHDSFISSALHLSNFSATSTPKNTDIHSRMKEDLPSDSASISSDNSFEMSPNKSSRKRQDTLPMFVRDSLTQDTVIRSRYEQLQDEISQLSDQLHRETTRLDLAPGAHNSLFAEVDHSWLCEGLGAPPVSDLV